MAATDFQRTLGSGSSSSGFGRSKAFFTRIHLDLTLLLLLLILSVSGLLLLYSGSGQSLGMVKRQAIHFGIGFIVLITVAQLQPRILSRLALPAYIAGIAALVAVLVAGDVGKGAQRWLALPGLPRFQPSELVKLALPLFVAWFLSRRSIPPTLWTLFLAAVMVLLPTVLI
ncbi:MAG: FtsW/RodA/SpoVE family cell cycle protein, partial [Oceanobacter sp.]